MISVKPVRAGFVSLAGPRWLPVLLLVSGFVAVVYEIVWQRQFALLFGSAAPATAAVLAAYFAGLGAGAWFVGRLASRWRRPLLVYAALEILIGLGALLVTPLIGLFDEIYPALFAHFSDHPEMFTAARVTFAFLTLLLPTFCMGDTLPVMGALVDGDQGKLGLTAGWLYVVNTFGAGCGALAVPFLLLPHLGLRGSVWLCVALNGLVALVAWVVGSPNARQRGLPAGSRDWQTEKFRGRFFTLTHTLAGLRVRHVRFASAVESGVRASP